MMPGFAKRFARTHPKVWEGGIVYHAGTALFLIWVWWEINRKG